MSSKSATPRRDFVNWYCGSCGRTHTHTAEERDAHRDYLRRMEAARIDLARRSAPRCDALARRGTGVGACDTRLDQHGNCAFASAHLQEDPG